MVSESFQHRRKMLRQSLKDLLLHSEDARIRELPEKWATKRPEQLTPEQFVELTMDIYGPLNQPAENKSVTESTLSTKKINSSGPKRSQNNGSNKIEEEQHSEKKVTSEKVWRAKRI